eukprot:6007318-Amphidinium_carterae.1
MDSPAPIPSKSTRTACSSPVLHGCHELAIFVLAATPEDTNDTHLHRPWKLTFAWIVPRPC